MTSSVPQIGNQKFWLCFVAVTLSCAVADWPGLYWVIDAPERPPVTLTLGVAIAGLAGGGLAMAPAISLGLLIRFLAAPHPAGALPLMADAIGITAGAMLGATLIWQMHAKEAQSGTLDKVLQVAASCAAATLVCGGVHFLLAVTAGGRTVTADLASAQLVRNALGQVIAVPLGFAWAGLRLQWGHLRRTLHFLLAMLATAASAWAIFVVMPDDPLAWAVLPTLIWAALAFHFRGATAAILIVTAVTLYGTSIGRGPFYEFTTGHEWQLQAYLGTIAATFLILAHLDDGRRTDAALRDTTRRLREREAQLSNFIADAPAAVAMFDREMRFLAHSARYLTDQSLPHDTDLVGHSHEDVQPAAGERWRSNFRRVLAGEELSGEEAPFHSPGDRIDYFRWKMKAWRDADGAIGGVILFSEKVTDAVTARREAADANARYRGIFEQSRVGIARSALDTRFIEVNDRCCEIAGIPRERFVGATPAELNLNPNPAERLAAAEGLVTGRIPSYRSEQKVVHASGEERWVDLTVSLVRDADGKPLELVSIVQDATARKQAELALAESETRLRLAQDGAGVGVWEHRFTDNQTFHSPVSQRLHDLEPRESGCYGPDETFDRFDAGDRDRMQELVRSAVVQRNTQEITLRRAVRAGGHRWLRSIFRFDDSRGEPRLLGLAFDITEETENLFQLHQARDQLLRVSRLSAMGTMASTLAHELNQPLAAIANFAAAGSHHLAVAEPPPATFLSDLLERIASQAQRAGDIVRKMRHFTISGQISLEPHSVEAILHAACNSALERRALAGVELRCHAGPSVLPVMADRVQIEQVLLNLIQNAAEATEGCPSRCIDVSAQASGKTVIIAIADTGSGMPSEILDNLFEPFRTTKATGTGLGLPICRTIVEAHGGRLWAEPRPEGGTILKFSLKAAAKSDA